MKISFPSNLQCLTAGWPAPSNALQFQERHLFFSVASPAGFSNSSFSHLPHYSFGATIIVLLMRPLATTIRRAILLFACLPLLILTPISRSQDEPPPATLPVYEFHSGFWLNLHHTLYRQARLQRSSNATAIP